MNPLLTLIFSVLTVVMLFLHGLRHFPKISRGLVENVCVEPYGV